MRTTKYLIPIVASAAFFLGSAFMDKASAQFTVQPKPAISSLFSKSPLFGAPAIPLGKAPDSSSSAGAEKPKPGPLLIVIEGGVINAKSSSKEIPFKWVDLELAHRIYASGDMSFSLIGKANMLIVPDYITTAKNSYDGGAGFEVQIGSAEIASQFGLLARVVILGNTNSTVVYSNRPEVDQRTQNSVTTLSNLSFFFNPLDVFVLFAHQNNGGQSPVDYTIELRYRLPEYIAGLKIVPRIFFSQKRTAVTTHRLHTNYNLLFGGVELTHGLRSAGQMSAYVESSEGFRAVNGGFSYALPTEFNLTISLSGSILNIRKPFPQNRKDGSLTVSLTP